MIHINLLPKEHQEKGKGLDWIILGYALTLFTALGIGAYHLFLRQEYNKDLVKKSSWSLQLQQLKSQVAQVEQLDAQKAVLSAKKNTVIQLFQDRLLYPKLMASIYDSLPQDIWLNELTFSEDSQRNIQVVATSISLSTDAIADWLQKLESKKEKYKDSSLSAIEVKESSDSKQLLYEFTMTFTCLPS